MFFKESVITTEETTFTYLFRLVFQNDSVSSHFYAFFVKIANKSFEKWHISDVWEQ
jgi:hypothetical protein